MRLQSDYRLSLADLSRPEVKVMLLSALLHVHHTVTETTSTLDRPLRHRIGPAGSAYPHRLVACPPKIGQDCRGALKRLTPPPQNSHLDWVRV